jgi:hypothetical protein
MTDQAPSVVHPWWTVVEFDEDDPYTPWCSEQSPEQSSTETSGDDNGPR